jgi:hypothetical protein
MKEQRVLVIADETSNVIQRRVEEILEEGWWITSVSAQHVSTGSSQYIKGGYFIIFERFILNQINNNDFNG